MRELKRCCLLLAVAGSFAAADWVTGGGNPERSGIARVSGPTAPAVLWQGTINGSFGEPIFIWEDKLVTCRYDFTDGPVVCHDLTTGDTLWTRDLGAPGGRSWPVGFRDSKVYVVEFTNPYPDTLYALDATSGSTVWTADLNAHMYITESVTFAENGDLVLSCQDFRTARIDHLTGDTVWTTSRVWPVSGSADLTVSGSSFYCFGGALVGGFLKVYAFDLASGRKRDSVLIEDTHPGGSAPYGNIIVGPDQVLYAHRCADNVTAIEDSGDSLHVRWVHEISEDPAAPFAQLACGPDSSVYVLSSGRVVRLDPLTGAGLDSTPVIKDPAAVFAAHLAVGADGTVYATNGGYGGGALYALTPNLGLLWVDSIPDVSTSNPAIGSNGELAIAGGGATLKVYRTPTATSNRTDAAPAPAFSAAPNPLGAWTRIRFTPPTSGSNHAAVCDAAGRVVRRLAGTGILVWDGKDDAGKNVAPGVYHCRSGTGLRTKLVKTR